MSRATTFACPEARSRILKGRACLEEGLSALAARDGRFARARAVSGPLKLHRRPGGFRALLEAIVSQQISTAAADAVWARLEAAGLTAPEALLAAPDAALRGCGLSRPKIRYARALAEARISWRALQRMADHEVIATLIRLPGIGPWSAQIYAMFSLRRADVFAPGDLALQEAARLLFDLPERPTERAFAEMAEAWAPWRAVAARQLWAYYRAMRNRKGIRW